MPPKGKAKAGASPANYYGSCQAVESKISEHQCAITDDLKLILSQEGMSDLLRDAGGSPAQAKFCPKQFGTAMSTVGVYRCGANGLWASLATGPVAPSRNKFEMVIKDHFPAPRPVFPSTIIFAITKQGPNPMTIAQRGLIPRVSPEEMLQAWVSATARSLRAGEGDDIFHQWIAMVHAAPLEFRKYDSAADIFTAQVNERENIGRQFVTMFRSVSGRIMEIVAFAEAESKRLKRELSRQQIADTWQALHLFNVIASFSKKAVLVTMSAAVPAASNFSGVDQRL